MFKGRPYRVRVNDFAAPRMTPGELHDVTSKQEAEQRIRDLKAKRWME